MFMKIVITDFMSGALHYLRVHHARHRAYPKHCLPRFQSCFREILTYLSPPPSVCNNAVTHSSSRLLPGRDPETPADVPRLLLPASRRFSLSFALFLACLSALLIFPSPFSLSSVLPQRLSSPPTPQIITPCSC